MFSPLKFLKLTLLPSCIYSILAHMSWRTNQLWVKNFFYIYANQVNFINCIIDIFNNLTDYLTALQIAMEHRTIKSLTYSGFFCVLFWFLQFFLRYIEVNFLLLIHLVLQYFPIELSHYCYGMSFICVINFVAVYFGSTKSMSFSFWFYKTCNVIKKTVTHITFL